MDDAEARYVADNSQVAEHALALLQDRRLLRERYEEDYEECRLSAQDLRGTLGNLVLAVQNGGFLKAALQDMQRACTNFVTAAGKNSRRFYEDDQWFNENLNILRLIFAQRLRLIVISFDLVATSEIQQVIDYAN